MRTPARGIVAAGNPHTARAGADVLRDGGNAVDAAVAAAVACFSAEPLLASAGGAGLMTVALPGAAPAVLDFFPRAPGLGGAPPTHPDFVAIEIDFGPATQTFHVGRGSAAVPLALQGLAEASRRFGRLPLSEVAAAGIEMARRGVPLSPEGAMTFGLLQPIICRDPIARRLLLPDGATPRPGDLLPNPALADTLCELARTGALPETLKRGLIEGFGPARGGLITEADFEAASGFVTVAEPHRATVGDWEVLTSHRVGGVLMATIAARLGGRPAEPTEPLEILRMAQASREAHLRRGAPTARGSTTHISVIDAQGGAASVTLSNGEGSGHFIEGTGVHVNNFLGEEDLNPEGFHHHAPGTPLPTMVAPTLVLHRGRPALALGSGGSNRIRSSVSEVLYRVTAGHSLDDAVLAPRVHAEEQDVWVELEGLADPDACVAALQESFARVHPFPTRAFFFGGVHAAHRDEQGTLCAMGDPRRGGAAERVG